MLIETIIAAAITGTVVGVLGGGGASLAVPMLIYIVGLDSRVAITTTLLALGFAGVSAAYQNLRKKNVDFQLMLVFASGSMTGAAFGGWVSQFFEARFLLILFALIKFVAAFLMLRNKQPKSRERFPYWMLVIEAIMIGTLAGMVGTGGGFLIVLSFVLFGGLDVRKAIGTSLPILSVNAFTGFLSNLTHVEIDWEIAISFALVAAVAAGMGAMISQKIEASKLKVLFGLYVLGMAAFIFTNQWTNNAIIISAVVALFLVPTLIYKYRGREQSPAPEAT